MAKREDGHLERPRSSSSLVQAAALNWFNALMRKRRHGWPLAAFISLTCVGALAAPTGATAATSGLPARPAAAALADQQDLRMAADQIQAQALASDIMVPIGPRLFVAVRRVPWEFIEGPPL